MPGGVLAGARFFTERRVPITANGVGMALERNPEPVAAMVEAGWEISSRGYAASSTGRATPVTAIEEDARRGAMRLTSFVVPLALVAGPADLGLGETFTTEWSIGSRGDAS